MSAGGATAGRLLLGGTVRVFLAEALILPTALITAGYLTRRLGPSAFGLLTLTTAIVAWLEWTLTALFARASVKVVADARDWRPAGTVVLRLFAISGIGGAILLWVTAAPLAALMHEPTLARYLRILALDVPIFLLAQAHLQILVGTGAYSNRARVAGWRWMARMVLVVGLVAAGFSVEGALAGIIGASVIELIVVRRFVRPALRGGDGVAARMLWAYALPLFVAAMCLRLVDKLDLFALKALGATAALAGQYGAAQNLAIVPGLVALALSSLLLSTLSRSVREGRREEAATVARSSLRGVFLLLPFAGMTAGTATGVATLIFGSQFAASGPLLAILIFGALALMLISITSALLIAAGRASWTMALALPLLPIALIAHLVVIPRYGAAGAAAVTSLVTIGGALAALVAVHRAWHVAPPVATTVRATVICGIAYAVGASWNADGGMVVLALVAIAVLIGLLYWVLGEFDETELALAGSLLRRGAPPFTPAEPR